MDAIAPRYGNYRRILFCTDFSPNAEFAFDFAVDAAVRNNGCTLYLLHIVPEPEAQFWKGYIYESDQNPDIKAKADIDAKIAVSYTPRVPAGVSFEVVFRIGNAGQEILAFAEERDVDLIIVGRQGHGAMRSLFFGNVASKVARNANCPVLIIPLAFTRKHPMPPGAQLQASSE
ncbi:MAG: universal stress protein [Kiritimatiellae bacterium]|nr:universal stress protein [Kiritimatiellia bacterium]